MMKKVMKKFHHREKNQELVITTYIKNKHFHTMFTLFQNSNYNGMSLPQLTKSQSPYKPTIVQSRSKLDHLPTI